MRSPHPSCAMTAAGAVWSLALLTKIHAWFLLPILGSGRSSDCRRGVPLCAMAVWTVVGIGLFWAGWPWLWYDSWARLWAYWGTGVERATIQVQYFGRVYADRDVPWHYPWVYFATTVPVGFQVLGVLGVIRGWRQRRADPFPLLLAGSILFFLILFSTRVPGLRWRAPVPPCVPGLGHADRPGVRLALGAASRASRRGSHWSPLPDRPGVRRGRDASVRAELLQRAGRRTAGCPIGSAWN